MGVFEMSSCGIVWWVQLSFSSYNACRKGDDGMDIMTSMLILNIVLLLAGCVQMGDGKS